MANVENQPYSKESGEKTTWTVQTRGIWKLPRRLKYTIADFSYSLFWSTVAIIPSGLLVLGLFLGGEGVAFYEMYCAIMLIVLFQTSERFIESTVSIDESEINVKYLMGEPTMYGTDHETTLEFDDLEAARFFSFGDDTFVRLDQKRSFAEGTAFVIPQESKPQFRKALRQHEIPIQKTRSESADWIRKRSVITTLLLFVIPTVGFVVWPILVLLPYLLVVLVNLGLAVLQGE